MSSLTLLLIAVGVSADAFAVALGKGLQMRRAGLVDALAIALTFGVFQALMPLIGWFLGSGLRGYIAEFDHWIAFALLALIGGKMILEAVRSSAEASVSRTSARELVVLGVATSIDALAVGVGFAFLDVRIVPAVLIIGITTAVLSLVGVAIGHRAGARFRRPAEIAGGVILILIGLRILLDHLGVI